MHLKAARSSRIPLFLISLAAILLWPTGAHAAAKYAVSAKVVVTGADTRLFVTLSSNKKVSSKYKPSTVSVAAAGKTLKLKKTASPKTTLKYLTTWQSGKQTGNYAEKLKALGSKKVTVTSKARAGKVTKKLKAPLGGLPAPGGTAPLFAAPGKDLIGMDAYNHLSPYFLNSAFSDCAAGPWPKCGVENRYVHCPNFSWRYMRTSGLGSDINAYDNFTVTGANVSANGAWAISYTSGTGGNYVWQVGTNGVVAGTYQFGANPTENLGTLYWSQPAIAWDQLSGAC